MRDDGWATDAWSGGNSGKSGKASSSSGDTGRWGGGGGGGGDWEPGWGGGGRSSDDDGPTCAPTPRPTSPTVSDCTFIWKFGLVCGDCVHENAVLTFLLLLLYV